MSVDIKIKRVKNIMYMILYNIIYIIIIKNNNNEYRYKNKKNEKYNVYNI